MRVKILVLGGGGREHALVWRLRQDPDVREVLAAPGNPGMAADGRCVPVDLARPADVLALAEQEGVDLTVVGPEAPLTLGLGDLFRQRGRPILGPSRRGAALEGSKVQAKHFMAEHEIPTARFRVCDDLDTALSAVSGDEFGWPVVIKADGLAAGKGVVIAEDAGQAQRAVRGAMVDRAFGAAGARLVVEECLTGPEISFFVLCDGRRAVPLSTAQDHKRIWDDDRGPNTGGMGAFAPSPLATDELQTFALDRIVRPALEGMEAAGEPYVGFLYVSLMLTPAGPAVIEFNVRFGDPEAQVVLPLIEGPLGTTLRAAAAGRLDTAPLAISTDRTVGVVLASRGYPASSESGRVIDGLDRAAATPGALVFHAGTRAADDRIATAGGRVLTIVGRGPTYAQAMETAYRAAGLVHFDGMQYQARHRPQGTPVRCIERGISVAQVLILMGSDSDAAVMSAAGDSLTALGISWEMTVASAHRSPARVMRLVSEAPGQGVRVFIVGAGAAAHLAGVVAAHTTLPVIGVPIDSSALKGLDALLATVQMPPGVPVATVAIGKPGATNAGVLAAQMMALADPDLAARLVAYKAALEKKVEAAAARLAANKG